MSGSRYFDRIAVVATGLMLILTLLFMKGTDLGIEVMAHTMGYENRLFDNTQVHTVDIVMDNWDDFIEHATSEEYYAANVVIDGEAYKNVGIRAKGNTSLSTVSALGSERYSFKIEFDHYDDTVSYHGLDKLSLNNLIQDSTMMKDYLTYTMMNQSGVASSLCSYVYITVNGNDWGLYLAVEGVEEAFLERNYGSDYGELYKPDSMNFGGGVDDMNNAPPGKDNHNNDRDVIPPDSSVSTDEHPHDSNGMGAHPPNNNAPNDHEPPAFDKDNGQSFSPGGGMGSSDVKLQYIDDNPDSYTNIWDNAKTDISEADRARLINSLKKLSANEDIDSVVDIEQVLRYFVVHNYVCNGDSYTGSMIHNYYLYEKDGRLAMLPWDYNLAFGTFQGSNAGSTVNTPIDSPIDHGNGEDRPMWNWIVENEEYTQLYHQYFSEFLNTVDISGIIDQAYDLIKSYVAKDPTAFYTYEEFELGVETLRQFCSLRSQSISMQLDNGETVNTMNYADASGITLSDMGSMDGNRGGFEGGMPEMPDDWKDFEGNMPDLPDDWKDFEENMMPDMPDDRKNFDGNMPDFPDMPGK